MFLRQQLTHINILIIFSSIAFSTYLMTYYVVFLYVWKKNGCIDCFPEMEKHTGQQEQEAGDDEYVLGVKK